MSFQHVVMAIIVAAIWGSNFIVVKIGLQETSPFFYGAARFILSALPALFIKKPPVPWRLIISIALSLGVLKFSFLFLGIHQGVPASLASLILQTQVFFTLLLSLYFYRIRIYKQQIIGMGIAFLGIVVVAYEMGIQSTISGFLMIIIAAISWGYSNILYRKAGNVDMFALTVWASVIPPIPMIIFECFYEGPQEMLHTLTHLSGKGMLCLLYTAVASTLLASTLWAVLLKRYEPHRVAPYSLLVPIFGCLFAHFCLNETFSPSMMVASALVFTGLIINQFPIRKVYLNILRQKPKHPVKEYIDKDAA